MTGPDRIWAFDYDLQDNDGTWRNWQCWSDSDPKPLNAAQYIRRDPIVLAALPEVQAMIARPLDPAPYDFDIAQLFDAVQIGGKVYVSMDSHIDLMERHSALARIEREAEARGRVKGLREAAGVCRKVRASSADESEGVGALDCASAILARADHIEKEGGA